MEGYDDTLWRLNEWLIVIDYLYVSPVKASAAAFRVDDDNTYDALNVNDRNPVNYRYFPQLKEKYPILTLKYQ